VSFPINDEMSRAAAGRGASRASAGYRVALFDHDRWEAIAKSAAMNSKWTWKHPSVTAVVVSQYEQEVPRLVLPDFPPVFRSVVAVHADNHQPRTAVGPSVHDDKLRHLRTIPLLVEWT